MRRLANAFLLCLVAVLLTVTSSLTAQETGNQTSNAFNKDEARQAVEKLASLLEENFIYPEVGKSYAAMLRAKLRSGAYANFDNAEKFAQVVTADLQATQPEGHLRLQPPKATDASNQNKLAGSHLNGVGKYGWLTQEVGYLSFHGFSGNREQYDKMLTKLRSVLDELSAAKTLIIDARSHPGGAIEEMDVMFSYFFEQPTTLVMMDTRLDVEKRGGNPLTDGATLKRVASPEGIVRRAHGSLPLEKQTNLNKAKIFLLTSKKTASAGEHLALALKRTGRATLIGETTAGAGHFGRTAALGGGYRAFIPVGRTFDPDTDKGWEQTGVEPHIKIAADQALDEALRRIGISTSDARKALESFKTEQSAN